MRGDRIENQSWDFKETFEMWHTKNKEKGEAEIKFCEQTAAFAGKIILKLKVSIRENPLNPCHPCSKIDVKYFLFQYISHIPRMRHII